VIRERHYGLFVTGTDTGVGKTVVATAMARLLRIRGVTVQPRKPVESGCCEADGRRLAADAACLRAAAGLDVPLEAICAYAFEAPLSPERAAAIEGITLSLPELTAASLNGVNADDFLLVEGAGGFYSPLASGVLNADLAVELGLPVLLVTADRLGTISNTLMAAETITRRGLELKAVVLNRVSPTRDPKMDNADDLSRWLTCPVFVSEHVEAGLRSPDGGTPCPALSTLAEDFAALYTDPKES
jgi:dethiobiotin synthetase